jgi:hypothetical protein
MNSKVFGLLLLAVIVPVVVALQPASNAYHKHRQQHLGRQQNEDPTTLRARIKRGRQANSKKVVLQGAKGWYEEIHSLDQALSKYSVVVAEPVEKRSLTLDPWRITTFYTFRVVKNLSQKDLSDCCVPKGLPAELPPLSENEIYVRVGGGTITIDGIEVTEEEEFGGFNLNERYLIFLSLNASEKLALIKHGPYAVFKVKAGDSLESLVDEPHVLKREIEHIYGGRLHRLETDLLGRQTKKSMQ